LLFNSPFGCCGRTGTLKNQVSAPGFAGNLTFPPPFAIHLSPDGEGAVRVAVHGELDLSTSPELGDALRRELNDGRSVIVDLSNVTFIDSTALNTLVGALRLCESNGTSLAVGRRLPAQVSRVFEITGLDAVLPVASD
jgi:anti-sigma B factor antagonist